ncbi:MAG: hypothetical protein VB108_08435 [Anaerolineaceae bacterium]|nr:hypothetical protein [Anaerolineaceae bacterium]
MKGISSQGFWGDVTTNCLEEVGPKTIDQALKGKAIYIPGALNKTISFFGQFIPRHWAAAYIYARWQKAQNKWLDDLAQPSNTESVGLRQVMVEKWEKEKSEGPYKAPLMHFKTSRFERTFLSGN